MGLSCTCHRAQHRQRLLLRAHLNPHLGQAAFHGANSCPAGGGLQLSSLECVWGRTSQSQTGSYPPALFLNGAVGHGGTVHISDSQAVLGSLAALQPACSPPGQDFGIESGMWTVPVFHESLWALNPLGAYIRDRCTLSHTNIPSENWDEIAHRPRSCRLLHLQFGS